MQSLSADPMVGTTIGHYQILAKLGGGGMGIVYTARDTQLGRRVALKFLPPQWSHDESAKQRFIREAQAASTTDHRNICTIHNIETTPDGQLFIVMAHYDGQTLKERLENGPLPAEEAVDIAAQIAEGLTRAHAQGVVHRDIKPGNLMLTEDGVKILDFGLAKFADSLQLTTVGSTLGTVAYMAPEQTRGEETDARGDVWAVGVVLYEMLCGQLPFRGAYPEAIAHAIRHDAPPPPRTLRAEVSEPLERLVLATLQKKLGARTQTARDLARELRLFQGRTLPIDLRTETLAAINATQAPPPRRRRRARMAMAASAAVLILGGLGVWLVSPAARVPIVVAPVANQTGYAELDPYRMALTQELIAELAASPLVRVMPYERVLQVIRRYRVPGQDVSSREALRALTVESGAAMVIVPTLLYENGSWRARIEFRNPQTGTNVATYETPPVVSSLIKDAAFGRIPVLTAGVESHFLSSGPSRRAAIAAAIGTLAGRSAPPPRLTAASLDAAAAFEEGLDAYEQQELSMALRAFTLAMTRDTRNPLFFAWQSRVANLMRRDKDAGDAAAQAARLLTPQTPASERDFVEAVVAESGRDPVNAEEHYRDLIERRPDDARYVIELAGFLDRQLRAEDAVSQYHNALDLDATQIRPHLELCRLYGPQRLNDVPLATQHGQTALTRYRSVGARAGEAQALWCLTDVLQTGGDAQRADAVKNAENALRIFAGLNYPYNLSRAYNYAAIGATRQGRIQDAATLWEQSLANAQSAGNAGLEPAVLTNLGAMYESLGKPQRAVENFRRANALFEALGQEQQAAINQSNAAAIVIEYGGDLQAAIRDVQNALAVFRKLGDKRLEAFSIQKLGEYQWHAGYHAEAERELQRAIAIGNERQLHQTVNAATLQLAIARFDAGDYAAALSGLTQVIADGAGQSTVAARIWLGRTYTKLGNLQAANEHLESAKRVLEKNPEDQRYPLENVALGDLALQSGQFRNARTYFAAAANAWSDDLADAASVEARAFLGVLDAFDGRPSVGDAAVRASLSQAQLMGRLSLEARCRLHLARIAMMRRDFDGALRWMAAIPADESTRTIGRDLRAEVHYWTGRALTAQGDVTKGSMEIATALGIREQIGNSLPDGLREAFLIRRDIAWGQDLVRNR